MPTTKHRNAVWLKRVRFYHNRQWKERNRFFCLRHLTPWVTPTYCLRPRKAPAAFVPIPSKYRVSPSSYHRVLKGVHWVCPPNRLSHPTLSYKAAVIITTTKVKVRRTSWSMNHTKIVWRGTPQFWDYPVVFWCISGPVPWLIIQQVNFSMGGMSPWKEEYVWYEIVKRNS